jgi:thiamine biosynthesis protein ThiI
MDLAKEIGTYEKSIEPYEDCCTVFLPKHPVTKPKLEKILASEAKLDCEGLIDAAVASDEIVNIYQGKITGSDREKLVLLLNKINASQATYWRKIK